jgi:enediyne biosynthesis protein E4
MIVERNPNTARAGRRAARSVAAVALLAMGVVAPGGPARGLAGSVTVTLSPTGPTAKPQGMPFLVKAVASNPDPGPVVVQVIFSVSQGGGTPVDAVEWTADLPGLGSAQYDLTLTPAQWFAGTGSFDIVPMIDDVPAGNVLSVTVLAPPVRVPLFEDVTAAAGLDTSLPGPYCWRFGTGAAWGDANGDSKLDLYVPAEIGPAQLWIQDTPGHFTDQAADRGAQNEGRVGMGAVFVDYDNDGDPDLYVTNDGINRLYQNDGTGHFTDVASQAGVADGGAGPSSAWADYDNDGHLDLYVVNYTNCSVPAQKDKLYHNEGDGTFTDQTALLGPPEVTTGVGYQATWFDYDHDGDQDLYLANDKLPLGLPGNHLWRNDGPGQRGSWSFTDVSEESGTDWVIASMGIGISDFDRDQDLDFAVSKIEGNLLARNNGDGTFTDVAALARVERPFQFAGRHSITWGLAFYDFNLDTWEDLYVAAGTIYDIVDQPNELFVSDTKGRFLDLSAPSGSGDPGLSRGVAFADYDGDGMVDLYVVDQSGSPRLYHNVTSDAGVHWLEVDTVGTASNRDGCGARLTLVVAGARLLREVFCGSISLSSGADAAVHFGLGAATTASRLIVEWPSGRRQVLRNLAADRRITVTEPAA